MKKRYSIIVPEKLFDEVRNHLLEDRAEEAAAFLLAGVHSGDHGVRLLARRMVTIPRDLYRKKLDYHLDIAPKAINGLASLCEVNNLTAIICHSHTRSISSLAYSSSDNYGEARISRFLQDNASDKPVGSLLLSEIGLKGRTWQNGKSVPVDSISTVGEVIHILTDANRQRDHTISQRHSRQVALLGAEGQRRVSSLRVGIVGVGGTGSCVAEQLARLGVASVLLIDDDYLEESNVSRMYGTYPDQFKKRVFRKRRRDDLSKVKVIAKYLARINPDLEIEPLHGNVVVRDVARSLLSCDVILLCTDEHWGRSIVNQISYQYYIPVVNMGVRVDARNDVITAAAGDVHTLGPGKPCLWCYEFLKADRIAAESMLPDQRSERIREHYVEGLGPAPMVISLTSTVASLAVTELIHLVTGFREERSIKHLKWNIMDGQVWSGGLQAPEQCLCKKVLGYGDLKALPTHDNPDFVRRCRGQQEL